MKIPARARSGRTVYGHLGVGSSGRAAVIEPVLRFQPAVRRAAFAPLLAVALLAHALACRPSGCPSTVVPPEEAKIFAQQRAWLDAYRVALDAHGPGARSRPVFGGHLLTADSNRGAALLQDDAPRWVELSLDRFQELGMKGVTLNLGYPMLLPSFPDAERYLAFYRQVAASVRRRGMTLAIEQIVLYTRSPFSPFDFAFDGLTLERYAAEQARMAQIVIDELSPDYLTVLHEPDTVAELTGLESMLRPEVADRFVTEVTRGLRRGKTRIGAGSGSWTPPDFAFAFAKNPNVDYVDIHVYWINEWSIQNTFAIARAAEAQNKPVGFTEIGLYKTVGDGLEGTAHVEGVSSVYRRDVFGFWAPLDAEFLALTAELARAVNTSYVSAYWTNMFFSYVDWTPETAPMTYQQLNAGLSGALTAQAWMEGRFTCTGEAYREIIAAP